MNEDIAIPPDEDEWDFEAAERQRAPVGRRAVVMVSFTVAEFTAVGEAAEQRGQKLSEFVRDAALGKRMAVNGKVPNLMLVIKVEEAFMHCPKCMIRSRLWKPEEWPDRSDVPTVAEALVAHTGMGETLAVVKAVVDEANRNRLY